MSDAQPPPPLGGFQPSLEAIEGYHGFGDIPSPVNPLQAQTAFEKRARVEDYVAHFIGIIMTSGFFMLAFAVLLGFVDISNEAPSSATRSARSTRSSPDIFTRAARRSPKPTPQ